MNKTMSVLLITLMAGAAFADKVSGVLVDQRPQGYIMIESEHGDFAFDDSQMSPELLKKVEACVGEDATATYNDMGMIDQLVSISCR